jgi:hypothetical protein
MNSMQSYPQLVCGVSSRAGGVKIRGSVDPLSAGSASAEFGELILTSCRLDGRGARAQAEQLALLLQQSAAQFAGAVIAGHGIRPKRLNEQLKAPFVGLKGIRWRFGAASAGHDAPNGLG